MTPQLVNVGTEQFWSGLPEHSFSSLFSSPLWIEALTRTYDFEILASAATNQGKIESAVLFSRVCDLRSDRVICLPFSDYCDPLVDDEDVWYELIQNLMTFALPVTLRCLRNEIPLSDARFRIVGKATWHGTDLTRPEEVLWAGLSGSARQNVRKAERNGVVVRETRDLEGVRIFHAIHCRLRKSKYRLLAQPLAFFENLYELFTPRQRITILLAEFERTPIAGIFFLEWGNTLYYKFNASLESHLCPNDLLAWEGIRMGHRRGLALLDFGLSDVAQPGLIRYKRKYASEEREIAMLRWEPPGHFSRHLDQANRTLNRITQLLTDPSVPDEITAAAGNELYRFFC